MYALPIRQAAFASMLCRSHASAAIPQAYGLQLKPSPRAGSPTNAAFDEKNIRRRVYDALNVLMAMDIISKDKKEIRWQGLTSAPADRAERLKAERGRLRTRLLQQHAYLRARSPEPCSSCDSSCCKTQLSCFNVHRLSVCSQ